jgi:hypothetical protein
LERASVESSADRAVFAIGELERYPRNVARPKVAALVASEEPSVAFAATDYLVRSDPADGSSDRAIAELIERSEPDARARLIESLVLDAPARVRLDLWPAPCDSVLMETATGSSAVAHVLLDTAARSHDMSMAARALTIVSQVGATAHDNEKLASAAVAVGVALGEPAVEPLFDIPWLRPALWAEVPRRPLDRRWSWLDALIDRDPDSTVASELASIYAGAPAKARGALERYALEALAGGRIRAEALVSSEPAALRDALTTAAEMRLPEVEAELHRLEEMIELGDRAAVAELAEHLEPLVTRAVERSVGNDRLRDDYAALLRSADHEVVQPAELVPDSEARSDALAALGPQLAPTIQLEEAGGGVSARIDPAAGARDVLRPFAIVDQMAGRGGSGADTARATRAAIAAGLAEAGVAQELLSELFERGPLFQAVLALSSDARGELIQASAERGFVFPDPWKDHPALGDWLQLALDGTTGVRGAGDEVHLLVRLQRVERDKRAAEDKVSAGLAVARRAFVLEAARPLEHLEETFDAYVQLWRGLARLGIRQVAALGQVLSQLEIDPEQHEVIESRAAESYVVRSSGVAIDEEIVRRARVEAID